MSSILDTITAYGRVILNNASPERILHILDSYDNAAKTSYENMPDEGEGVMTKSIYLDRLDACSVCTLRTSKNWCNPSEKRIHVSHKNSDGSPKWVRGCGCKLKVKQKDITEHCPAGEW